MEQQIKSNNTSAFDENHLRFRSQNLNAKYGCSVLFDDGKSRNEIRYKLDITFTGNLEDSIKTFIINREDKIYVNDVISYDFVDKLALETSKCLYPLHIKTKNDGKLIDLLNYEEIKERWNKTKKKLEEDYKSDLTEKYIKSTEKSLISKDKLLHKISKDWFLNLYFNAIYKFYSQDLYINEKLSYPVLGDLKPIEYRVVSKIELNEESEYIRLEINGEIDDERCALDFEQRLDTPYYKELDKNEKPLLGTCNLIYLLQGKTGVIEAIEGEFLTKLSTPRKILVKMYLLKKLDSKNVFVAEDEDGEVKKKSGFWSRIFKK